MMLGVVKDDDPMNPPKTNGCMSALAFFIVCVLLGGVGLIILGGFVYLIHLVWAPIIGGKL
jgi:hypothetical protein